MFQSLLGFLMRCDDCIVFTLIQYLVKFQSLLGFLMRCDQHHTVATRGLTPVSIPVGFSDALRRLSDGL